MILADKIIHERKRNGWSQEELADKLNVSRQAVSKWESAGSIPDLQKIIQMARLFQTTTDYLLNDDIDVDEVISIDSDEQYNERVRRVSLEEANNYLDLKKIEAATIANATVLCILSPVILIVLSGLSENHMFSISESIATGIGCTALFVMVAIAVYMFITIGIKLSHFEHFENDVFETEYGVTGMVKEKRRAFDNKFSTGIAIGTVLCIISVIPSVIGGTINAPDYVMTALVGVLLILVATGVNIIVRVAIIRGGYDTLLQEGEYTKQEKKFKRKTDALSGAYWCIVTAIYLGWSFMANNWHISWVVWPVAGVAYAAIGSILRIFIKIDE